eukprot:TRINITY_DN386_c0_g1_i3.p1 TRINITY_DN386_c0_g1~~TRINITY_DN386_c0_g1_i3.p1  ORF type:complete len:702 (-),score=172.16 TRINITY_DN386_c0_g1_i3:45-2117(-)
MGNDASTRRRAGIIQAEKEEEISHEQLEHLLKRRGQISKEILETERSYVRGLEILVNIWMKPLLEASSKPSTRVIRENKVLIIFSIIPDILKIHQNILKEMEEVISEWDDDSLLSPVFSNNAEALMQYTTFVNNYNESLKMLARCNKKQRFLVFSEKAKQQSGMDLSAYMIMPIQRLPRYHLLLEDLIKHTRKSHKDYVSLRLAAEEIKRVTNYINEQKGISENMHRVLEVQNSLNGNKHIIFTEGRWFISESKFKLKSKDSKKDKIRSKLGTNKWKNARTVHSFLFNDLLIVGQSTILNTSKSKTPSKKSYDVILKNFLNEVNTHQSADDPNVFKIECGDKQYSARFKTPEGKVGWITEFEKAKASMIEIMRNPTKSISSSNLRSPSVSEESKPSVNIVPATTSPKSPETITSPKSPEITKPTVTTAKSPEITKSPATTSPKSPEVAKPTVTSAKSPEITKSPATASPKSPELTKPTVITSSGADKSLEVTKSPPGVAKSPAITSPKSPEITKPTVTTAKSPEITKSPATTSPKSPEITKPLPGAAKSPATTSPKSPEVTKPTVTTPPGAPKSPPKSTKPPEITKPALTTSPGAPKAADIPKPPPGVAKSPVTASPRSISTTNSPVDTRSTASVKTNNNWSEDIGNASNTNTSQSEDSVTIAIPKGVREEEQPLVQDKPKKSCCSCSIL